MPAEVKILSSSFPSLWPARRWRRSLPPRPSASGARYAPRACPTPWPPGRPASGAEPRKRNVTPCGGRPASRAASTGPAWAQRVQRHTIAAVPPDSDLCTPTGKHPVGHRLAAEDPGLGLRFAFFTRLTRHEAMPATEQVPGRRCAQALAVPGDGALYRLAQMVGSDRGALPGLLLVGFPGPPAAAGVRFSPHWALHVSCPLGLARRRDRLGCPRGRYGAAAVAVAGDRHGGRAGEPDSVGCELPGSAHAEAAAQCWHPEAGVLVPQPAHDAAPCVGVDRAEGGFGYSVAEVVRPPRPGSG